MAGVVSGTNGLDNTITSQLNPRRALTRAEVEQVAEVVYRIWLRELQLTLERTGRIGDGWK